MTQLLALLTAPKLHLPKFNGNPLQYHKFMTTFELNVENVITDDNQRLARLVDCCEGEAYKLTESCIMMGSKGYRHAKQLLYDNYGEDYIVTRAWVEQLSSGGLAKDPPSIQALAIDARACFDTLYAIDSLQEIDNSTNLSDIIKRLPTHAQNRWRRQTVRIRRVGRSPDFQDLLELIEDLAEESKEPTVKSTFTSEKPKPKQKASSFNTGAEASSTPKPASSQAKDRPPRCFMCDGAHNVWGCDTFKQKSIEERTQAVRKKGLCFNCFGRHSVKDCRSKHTCQKCSKRHHTLIHPEESTASTPKAGMNPDAAEFAPVSSTNALVRRTDERTALPVVSVKVKATQGGPEIQTYALLDSGSTTTFCTTTLAQRLGVKGEDTQLSLSTLSKQEEETATTAVGLTITPVDGRARITMPVVFTTKRLPVHRSSVAQATDVSRYHHLRELNIPRSPLEDITLLIGQDNGDLLVPRDVRVGDPGEPYAVRTILGWTVAGCLTGQTTHHTCALISTPPPPEQLERLWTLEREPYQPPVSTLDREVAAMWTSQAQREGPHYILPIPFKPGIHLPTQASKVVAEKRLSYLERKLRKDSSLHSAYTGQMTKLIEAGHAEPAPTPQGEGPTFYIPHHLVHHPKKKTPRVVFDCAARAEGRSLNDFTHSGPDKANPLIGVLLRFRERLIAIVADIRSMFYQVLVPEDQRGALCFMWWPEGDLNTTPVTYRHTRHLFGGKWSPSACMTALQMVGQDHGQAYHNSTLHHLKKSFYVDDFLASISTIEEAQQLRREITNLTAQGGFPLVKWNSNTAEVLHGVAPELLSQEGAHFTSHEEGTLGIRWDPHTDHFTLTTTSVTGSPTKRRILSTLSSIFDPLGVAGPYVLLARVIFQELCRQKIDWDDTLPSELLPAWEKWQAVLTQVKDVRLPRLMTTGPRPYTLHHFADASEKAYGVITYLLGNQGSPTFVMAKTRLAPLKKTTLPRLELLAAALAAKQDSNLKRELTLELQPSHFYSDSTIVLSYITNKEKRLHTFAANRVAAILGVSEPQQWKHVPTSLNPADHASRGLYPDELVTSNWLTGPPLPWGDWPQPHLKSLDSNDPEVKKERVTVYTTSTTPHSPLEKLCRHYSDWHRLKTGVAWLLSFINVKFYDAKPKGWIGAKEIAEAETILLRHAQRAHFTSERDALRQSNPPPANSSIKNLKPTFDKEEVMRVGGRLSEAPLPYSTKHPIIVPGNHPIATLILRDAHRRMGHAGRRTTLAETRQRYWITHGADKAYDTTRACFDCKKLHAPVITQQMADLPSDRVTPHTPPFQAIGVDYFGPILIKRGRGREKRWGCLITCLATRAVHLDIAHTLEADSFLQVLQRFIARRGTPQLIRSDQGRNFIRAAREITEEVSAWNKDMVQAQLNRHQINWLFNPPYSSHHGGVWERQIKTVRRVLAGLTTEQVLTDETLLTLLCMCESIINHRPLTAASPDATDLNPLTPSDLIAPKMSLQDIAMDTPSNEKSRQRWRQLAYLASVFWSRWTKEYLPDLNLRSKWLKETRGLKKGDLVLVQDISAPRNQWPLGRVITTPNKDQRSVYIKTALGEIQRPFAKLVLLEQDSDT